QHHAFLLVRVGASNHERRGLVAEIRRQMGHTSRDVKHLALPHDAVMLEPFAIPTVRLAGERIDRRLMLLMLVRLAPPTGWDREQVHADALRADRLLCNTLEIGEALLAGIGGVAGADDLACGLR